MTDQEDNFRDEIVIQLEQERDAVIQQLNQLQLLSRSQTAIIRANFNTKIKQRDLFITDLFEAMKEMEIDLVNTSTTNKATTSSVSLFASKMESLQARYKKILRMNAGLGDDEPNALVVENQMLKAENDRLQEALKKAKEFSSAVMMGIPAEKFKDKDLEDEEDEGPTAEQVEALVEQIEVLKQENGRLLQSSQNKTTTAASTGRIEALLAQIEVLRQEKEEMVRSREGEKNALSQSEAAKREKEQLLQSNQTNDLLKQIEVLKQEKEKLLQSNQKETGALKAALEEKQHKKDKEASEVVVNSQKLLEASQKDYATLNAHVEEMKKTITDLNARIEEREQKIKESTNALKEKENEKECLMNEKKKAAHEMTEAVKKVEKEKEALLKDGEAQVKAMEIKYKNEIKELNEVKQALRVAKQANETQFLRIKEATASVASEFESLKEGVREELQMTLFAIYKETGEGMLDFAKRQQVGLEQLRQLYKNETVERKRLHNLVQELRGNIRVFVRPRPPTEKEKQMDEEQGGSICVSLSLEHDEVSLGSRMRNKTYDFDKVFAFDASQAHVYEEVSPLVTSVLDGYNACLLAYGQTGTGKTHTMTGGSTPEQQGVNIRALAELFDRSQKRREAENIVDEISISILEIYNEDIRDLLMDVKEAGGKKFEIKQGPHGMFVTDLSIVPVDSLAQVTKLMKSADQHRAKATTNMNEHSSRSHSVLSVYLTSQNRNTNSISRGKLHLIDLAGSERVGKSGAAGQALKEAQSINKSLSALGDVIAARVNKQAHVPYRNSVLTYLLQDSLAGDSKCVMFVCISPVAYNAEETSCSLQFASRVRKVELGKATKNVTSAAPSESLRSTAVSPPVLPESATTATVAASSSSSSSGPPTSAASVARAQRLAAASATTRGGR